jgi:hypothetical protein
MLCRTATAFFILVAGFCAATAQTAKSWPEWTAEQANAVKIKRAAIKEAASYPDQICAIQTTEEKKKDCTTLIGAIIARRDKEIDKLLDMIIVAALPDKVRDAKLAVMVPEFRAADAFTTTMAEKFNSVYPRQPASNDHK